MTNRWPIQRTWDVLYSNGAVEQFHTNDLRDLKACVLLGSAGLGKTYEMYYLADLDRQQSLDVRYARLVTLGQTPDTLITSLQRLISDVSSNTVIYLDAFDELMIPVKTASITLQEWIKSTLSKCNASFRLSCRSAVWPKDMGPTLSDVFGTDNYAVARLQPLSSPDIECIANANGLNADAFASAIQTAKARTLSQQPLTLEMLLRLYKDQGTLPTRRAELFAQGLEHLASDRYDRIEAGTHIDVPVAELLEAAERLACFSLLTGSGIIDFDGCPSTGSLGRRQIEGLPGTPNNLTTNVLRAIGSSGLCDSDAPRQFRFAHRQFAEYLAGRRLSRLLLHQTRSLLSCGIGWRAGVAGPLRETAAFAALESTEIAQWLTAFDPEVIGLSDVVDDNLRKEATRNLLAKCRTHELTDDQVFHMDEAELVGFQYQGAEDDLRLTIRERTPDCNDVLECVVRLIQSWNLVSMSNDLADLILDTTAPLEARKAAGYTLAQIGTPQAKQRILPLAVDQPDDVNNDLKGLALRCNWPERLTVPELLVVLTPPRADNYHGAYAGFLFDLDRSRFDASGHALVGLAWARQFTDSRSDYKHTVRIARRIAIASLAEIDQPRVAEALADMLISAADTYAGSPLAAPTPHSWDTGEETASSEAILSEMTDTRHKLLDAIAARDCEKYKLRQIAEGTPSLLTVIDFRWLLEKAASMDVPMPQRERYAEMASVVSWKDDVSCIDTWLEMREIEPIASKMPYPICTDLSSEDASREKQSYQESIRREKEYKRLRQPQKLVPPPAKRVLEVLALCETKDPSYFFGLCRQMTLEEASTCDGCDRFLTASPGWKEASESTQARIIEAAKRFLMTDSDLPDKIRGESLNTIHVAHMAALWLLQETDRTWLEALPTTWWQRWAFYILLGLHPHMMDEPDEQKASLLQLLHAKATEEVQDELTKLTISPDSHATTTLSSLLGMFSPIPDARLDKNLCEQIINEQIPHDRIADVARFVLSRDAAYAMPNCVSLLNPSTSTVLDGTIVAVAVALMQSRFQESWNEVYQLLERRSDIAPRVLAAYASEERWASRCSEPASNGALLSVVQTGALVSLLIRAFPFETDPKEDGQAHCIGPDDRARRLRNQLISWLGEQKSMEAVKCLQSLEQQFGARYPWLRRPRAKAERSYRLSQWTPVPLRSVAELLVAGQKRLIRSASDVTDGIVEAVQQFANRLHHASPSDLPDLWNQPPRGQPSPKEEERISDKVCTAIRDYFRDYGVTADREVQIVKRLVPRAFDGLPGSEVDVLCRVPARATTNEDAIIAPIEVKLSHNREARTGLREQLVDRYMNQLGTSCGVFVVVWMGVFDNASAHQPMWDSLEAAREELDQQAVDVMATLDGADVRAIVLDASLPVASRSVKKPTTRRSSKIDKPPAKRDKKTTRKPDSNEDKRRLSSKIKAEKDSSGTQPNLTQKQRTKKKNT